MEAPGVDLLRNRFEYLTGLVNWIADVWQSKNLVRRLLLCDVIIFTLFNPYVPLILKIAPTTLVPKNYELYFWITVSLFFVIATIIAIRTKPNKTIATDITLRSPIKGLLPFDTADETIFARLQRNQELMECSHVIADNNFRIGILSAESGNGKTSFLRAGILPSLQKLNHRCIYIKVTDIDPITSIKQTLTDSIIDEIPEGLSLIETFKSLAKIEGRDAPPLVILLDQFEQFFVHQKRKKDREPFVKQLCDWYKNSNGLRVKILISIRSDFRGRLDEIHKSMGYSPGPQQIFILEKFLPEQAASIISTLADSAQMECDINFIKEMTEQELASSDDGLISPVDIQILSWMLVHQSSEADRSFTSKSFQRLGGVEGLLERFLSRALEARESQLQRKNAIHVLLGLTDLDRNTRTGPLTSDELKLKLGNLISESDLRESLEWLTRGDVRLVFPTKNNLSEVFELAHERIIPALRKVASKELSDTDKANLLLDRCAGDWQGNKGNKRSLLSLRELFLIRKQSPFLQWGQNKNVKSELISASYRRQYKLALLVLLPILLIISAFPLSKTQYAQLQFIKMDITELSKKTTDTDTLRSVASAYGINGNIEHAEKLLEKNSDISSQELLLSTIILPIIELGVAESRPELFERCIPLIAKLTSEYNKAEFKLLIAYAMYRLDDKDNASKAFERVQLNLEQHNYYLLPVTMRLLLARYAIDIGALQKTKELLSQIQNIIDNNPIDKPDLQDSVTMANLMSHSGNADKAIQLLQSINITDKDLNSIKKVAKAILLSNQIAGKSNDAITSAIQQLLNKRYENKYDDKYDDTIKIHLRIYITHLLYIHGSTDIAEFFERQTIDWLDFNRDYQVTAFNSSDIIAAISNIESNPKTVDFLKKLNQFASTIKNQVNKSRIITAIAIKTVEIAGEIQDDKLLDNVLAKVKKNDGDIDIGDQELMSAISTTMAKIATKQRNIKMINQAQESVSKINSLSYKPKLLISLAKAATACGDYSLARSIAKSQVNKDDELKTLAAILETKARMNNTKLSEGMWESKGIKN